MREGDIALAPLPQMDGMRKPRPVLLLRELLSFGDYLVCGVSTQIHFAISHFDEIIRFSDKDDRSSQLKEESVIRPAFLAVLERNGIPGSIGSISQARHERLLTNLGKYLIHGCAKGAG